VSSHDFPILPATRVAALLDRYPQLESVLIELAPPFRKLRNPLLRRGVAKVASLKHAAAVGGLAVEDLVNALRAFVGQETFICGKANETFPYFSDQPEWFSASRLLTSIDERTVDEGKMPIAVVLQEASRLRAGEIVELVTAFLPAPGIDIIRNKGLRVWSVRDGPELVRTYISESPE